MFLLFDISIMSLTQKDDLPASTQHLICTMRSGEKSKVSPWGSGMRSKCTLVTSGWVLVLTWILVWTRALVRLKIRRTRQEPGDRHHIVVYHALDVVVKPL